MLMLPALGPARQGVEIMKPALFFRDIKVVIDDGVVHLVGFSTADGERKSAAEPVAHFVMSNDTFRKLLAEGRVSLAKGGH
ncbi:hypothetical protein EOA60_04525 [Mesorhizobium sp. M1A.F.Ca.IN.020.06.1.1]|uniref:hypothetical protein n=1 Tax=unclassified Mesorhizobium TaxID=325217 RepID=UPI000FD58000|nr:MULTISPECIES: hypothetical protein [unclassified Mesorhizobium]RUW35429.1 hypothetical protein EOA60_04525 [Mesorhizobium sp. M1A.F.Ca.IN.020.06.1.1]RWG06167.1 MAG: hypothetical protein EOQ38_02000 [Mesorhizobium sp.]TIS43338.1 MAG: hypothetical protein E5X01_04455 [Mesorhizobium sp.]TIS95708.1 MAG: hypothetical protein E5W99_04470 [Mesorhizobium sp.]TJV12101.1 MAG: hypothetical protein E5Y35_03710 [Mesorhizobium sp.]